MKILVISDIHGNYNNLLKAYEYSLNEDIDQVIILGDTYSSFYSKSVDDDYITKILNAFKVEVIMIKGNCDSTLAYEESPYGLREFHGFKLGTFSCLAHHGNRDYSYLTSINLFLSGHTHRYKFSKINDVYYLNPGSLGRPRDGSKGTFMILSEKKVWIFDVENQLLLEKNL